jgi:molybdopterin converting factor small subunit
MIDNGKGNGREDRRVRMSVRLFALARQRAGRAEVVLDVPDPVTVAAVKAALADACPELAPLIPQMLIAINADYAGDEQGLIPPGAEVAAIPPVSGGGRPSSVGSPPSGAVPTGNCPSDTVP